MHELSLVQGLLGQLESLAGQHGASRILRVQVSIGEESCIVEDSFRFGFDAVKTESSLTREAELQIKKVPGNDLMLMQVEME